jgi:hypothetical protein
MQQLVSFSFFFLAPGQIFFPLLEIKIKSSPQRAAQLPWMVLTKKNQ